MLAFSLPRFQVTLFLLCDAIGLESKIVDTNFLQTLLLLGSYLEWEGIAAHDLFHRDRDAQLGTPNAFLYWKASSQFADLITVDMTPRELGALFLKTCSKNQDTRNVFAEDQTVAQSFDLALALTSSRAIVSYYKLQDFV